MTEGTETVAARYRGLDGWPTPEILTALWNGQMQAVAACLPALGALAQAVDAAAPHLRQGGRLVYVGAGSSGVIAGLDALELRSTFDWPEARTVVILPAGPDLSKEQAGAAEDDSEGGSAAIDRHAVAPADLVVAVSASGRSAFTLGALRQAARRGALTIAFTNAPGSPLAALAARAVVVESGAEVIAGSTRLGAGTAQKVLFNLFSTALMSRLGGTYDNLMVGLRADNAKLRRRAAAMIADIAGVDADRAAAALARFGSVKRAVLGLRGVPAGAIDARLAAAAGNLRRALADHQDTDPRMAGAHGSTSHP